MTALRERKKRNIASMGGPIRPSGGMISQRDAARIPLFAALTKARDAARHADPAQLQQCCGGNPSPTLTLPSRPFEALPRRVTGVYPSSLGIGKGRR